MRILHLLVAIIIGSGLVREICNDLDEEAILVYTGALVVICWHYEYSRKKRMQNETDDNGNRDNGSSS